MGGAGEVVLQKRACTALPEDLSVVPNTHTRPSQPPVTPFPGALKPLFYPTVELRESGIPSGLVKIPHPDSLRLFSLIHS